MNSAILLCLLVILQFSYTSGEIPTAYLNEMCGKSITVSTDYLVHWSRGRPQLPAGKSCVMDIKIDPSNPKLKLIGYLTSFSIAKKYNTSTCQLLSAQMLFNSKRLWGFYGQCVNVTGPGMGAFKLGAAGDTRRLSYKVGNTDAESGSFSYLLTAVLDEDLTGDCPHKYFSCTAGWCVPDSVVCNGYPNCGLIKDDERDCGTSWATKIPWIAGGVALVIALISILISVLLYRRIKKRNQARVYSNM